MKKTTFNLGNAFTQNTPNWAKIIGDIFLVFAVGGAAILMFVQLDGKNLSPAVTSQLNTIGATATAVGATLKFIMNMLGFTPPSIGNQQ